MEFISNILGFFAFGAIGFWLLLIVLSIIYTTAVEMDKHGLAIFGTFIAVLLWWNEISMLFQNWKLLLIGIVAYGIIGGAWSIFRWFRYCRKYVKDNPFTDKVREYCTLITKTPESFYKDHLNPSNHKSRLIGWIVYWPWSLLWNCAGDFVTSIYDALTNIYNRVSAAAINRAIRPPGE